jgi:hypothetical protein
VERTAKRVARWRHGASGHHETVGDRSFVLQAVDVIVIVCGCGLQGVDFRLQVVQPPGQHSTNDDAAKSECKRYEHHGQDDRRAGGPAVTGALGWLPTVHLEGHAGFLGGVVERHRRCVGLASAVFRTGF